MRFRLGLLIGFGSGYYLGSMAGRERYEQINRAIAKIKRSDAYETATEKVHDAVDTSVARAKETIHSPRSHNGDEHAATSAATTTAGSDPLLPPPGDPLP